MQEERVGEFLGLTVWEIPAPPSQDQQPPGPASSVLSLRHILQPNTWSSSHPLASQMKNWGHGAWASSQDHRLVRAGVGLDPWSQFFWSPHASHPPQAKAQPSHFSGLLLLSATRCLWGDKKQAGRRKGTRRIRHAVGLLCGLLRTDSVQGQRLCPMPAPPVWGQSPVPAAAMGPPAEQNLPGWPAPRCCPFWRLHRRISCPSLHKAFRLPAEVLWLSQPSLQNPSDTYSPFALGSHL